MKKALLDRVKEFFADEEVQDLICLFIDEKAKELAGETVYQMPLGEVLDKFLVCHIRMWNLEEEITSNKNDKEVAEASRRLRVVNAERARLREEINRRFSGYELGTQKSYMKRIDLFRKGEEDEPDGGKEK
jgi:hypothetical protein